MPIEKILLIRTYAPVTHRALCPPMGLMYIASTLRKSLSGKRKVLIVDMRLKPMTLQDIRVEMEGFEPDMIGISSLSYEASTLHEVARLGKKFNKDCLIVAGGPHPSMFFDKVLEDRNVDGVVVGEGEGTTEELIKAFENGKDLSLLPGFASRDERGDIHFKPRPFIEDLNQLPFPAWDLIDVEAYAKRPNMNSILKGKRYMALLTSRGCPYGCAYCHNLFGRGFRSRSPENVYEEMAVLRKDFGVDEFHIIDDIFNLDKNRAHTICDLMIKNQLKVSFAFPNGLRGDILDHDLINKMVHAGCYSITYAVETASPRLQKLLNKNINLRRLEQVIDWSFNAGIITKGFFMLGFPSETLEEINKTISFAARSRLLLAGFYCVLPFPRTQLFQLAQKEYPAYSPSLEDCFYYADVPYYTKKTGIDLRALQRYANRRFYLNPRRLVNLFLRIPRKRDLLINFMPFFQLAFNRFLPLIKKKQ